MSGAELLIVGPAFGLVMKLLIKYGLQSVSFNIEAYGLDILLSNVEDDIQDAWMFYNKLAKNGNVEVQLRSRVLHCIKKTNRILKKFKIYLEKHIDKRAWSVILGDSAKAKKLVAPLQASQAQLARRIDWMRTALADLDKGVDRSKGKEGLFSSVPPSEREG